MTYKEIASVVGEFRLGCSVSGRLWRLAIACRRRFGVTKAYVKAGRIPREEYLRHDWRDMLPIAWELSCRKNEDGVEQWYSLRCKREAVRREKTMDGVNTITIPLTPARARKRAPKILAMMAMGTLFNELRSTGHSLHITRWSQRRDYAQRRVPYKRLGWELVKHVREVMGDEFTDVLLACGGNVSATCWVFPNARTIETQWYRARPIVIAKLQTALAEAVLNADDDKAVKALKLYDDTIGLYDGAFYRTASRREETYVERIKAVKAVKKTYPKRVKRGILNQLRK